MKRKRKWSPTVKDPRQVDLEISAGIPLVPTNGFMLTLLEQHREHANIRGEFDLKRPGIAKVLSRMLRDLGYEVYASVSDARRAGHFTSDEDDGVDR